MPHRARTAMLAVSLSAGVSLPVVAADIPASVSKAVTSTARADVDPAVAAIQLPENIPWVDNPAAGNQTAALVGDQSKPGLYVILVRWLPGHMSRPHFHANDRYVTVLSGTWWVGTGDTFDPDSTVPVPPGTYVLHHAKQIHYDGAKEEPCVLEIVGMGPGTSIPAEKKP